MHIVATAVGAEGGRRTLGKRDQEGGKNRSRGGSAWTRKKAKGHDRDGAQSDRGQGWQATAEPGGEGQGGPGVLGDRETKGPSNSRQKGKVEVWSDMHRCPTMQGPGFNSTLADTNG